MASEQREETGATRESGDLDAVFAALVGLLVFGVGLDQTGLPESFSFIVPVSLIFALLVAALVRSTERYLHATNRRTLLLGHKRLSVVLFGMVFASALGLLSGLASSSENGSRPQRLVVYEQQVGHELQRLREANAAASEALKSPRRPAAYAESVRKLASAYQQAEAVLAGVDAPRQGDQRLHSSLVVALAAVGNAYAHLGDLVSGAAEAKIERALAGVQAATKELRISQEALRRHGYLIVIAD